MISNSSQASEHGQMDSSSVRRHHFRPSSAVPMLVTAGRNATVWNCACGCNRAAQQWFTKVFEMQQDVVYITGSHPTPIACLLLFSEDWNMIFLTSSKPSMQSFARPLSKSEGAILCLLETLPCPNMTSHRLHVPHP